jgi:hypothetical protein
LYAKHNQRRDRSSKSLSLDALRPVASVPGIQLYSLQTGMTTEERALQAAGLHVQEFGPDFDVKHGSFMDTAAVIANLNLVITVDTAVAHLAGALGVLVWVLLPRLPDWRWMLDSKTTPWYPTMRLFRQSVMFEWEGPIAAIANALAGRLRSEPDPRATSPRQGAR